MRSRDSRRDAASGGKSSESSRSRLPEPDRNRRNLSVDDYVAGILDHDRVILSRALTLVESTLPAHAGLAEEVLERCLPYSGKSIRVGITGAPGVGKSTFIEALGNHLTEDRQEQVAVLAIDPTSRRSKGSILGDKTRMERLAANPRAFIRPSPSGNSLGGVARRTRECMLLCEAAGFTTLMVETVGVGQSETAVHSMVDFFLLLLLAGAGDELQGIKRGIMEMTDLAVINKSDGDNRQRAEQARREFENALHYFPAPDSGWAPRAVTCSGLTGEGIPHVWDLVVGYCCQTRESGFFATRRREQLAEWMRETIGSGLEELFYKVPEIAAAASPLEQKAVAGEISPFRAARELLKIFRNAGLPPNPAASQSGQGEHN